MPLVSDGFDFLRRRIDRVNGIIQFFEDPCEAPWTVYVRCLFPPLGHFTLAILSFGLDDIMRGYFRPKGIYRRRRTRRGRFGKHLPIWLKGGIPEIGELVGTHLPGATFVKARGIATLERAFWIVDGVLQRGFFWWMIIDELSEFFYNWTTLVSKTEFCTLDKIVGAASCTVQVGPFSPEIPTQLSCSLLEKLWGLIDTTGGPYLFTSPIGVYAASVEVSPWIDAPGRVLTGVEVYIADPADPTTRLSGPSSMKTLGNEKFAAVCDAVFTGPRNTKAYVLAHGRNATVTDGYLAGWAYVK